MTRHSKNCTAGAFFTSAERDKLSQYGTQRERLGRDSLRTPIACVLCLREPASDAVACPGGGHVFCRECLLAHLVVCRREQARARAERERQRTVQARAAAEEEERRQQERIEAFAAANRPGGTKRARTADEWERGKETKAQTTASVKAGTGTGPATAFWLPERTPAVGTKSAASSAPVADSGKLVVYCPATAERTHSINAQHMVPIRWTLSTEDREAAICSVCTNSLRAVTAGLLLARPCGHVFCGKCIGHVVGDHGRLETCPECSQPVTDTLRLAGEGSGFAGGGPAPGRLEVQRYDPAFI